MNPFRKSLKSMKQRKKNWIKSYQAVKRNYKDIDKR